MNRHLWVLLLAFASTAVLADDFNYTYVEGGYLRTDLNSEDGDGLALSGSYAIAPSWHVFAGYSTSGFGGGVDLVTFDAGLGFNAPISDQIDVIATVAYVYSEVDTPFGSADDNGLGLGVGLRAHASDTVELNFGVSHNDVGNDSQTALNAGALFKVNNQIDVRLAGSWDDDVNTWLLSGRLYF